MPQERETDLLVDELRRAVGEEPLDGADADVDRAPDEKRVEDQVEGRGSRHS